MTHGRFLRGRMGQLRAALESELASVPTTASDPAAPRPKFDAVTGRPILGYDPQTGVPILGEGNA